MKVDNAIATLVAQHLVQHQRQFEPKRILHQKHFRRDHFYNGMQEYQKPLTPKNSYAKLLYTRRLLHQNLFTPGHLKLFNKKSFTPENLYRKGHFTPNGVNTRRLLPRSVYIYIISIYNLFEVAHRYVSIYI